MYLGSDRRQHPRYVLPSMYTEVALRPLRSNTFDFSGHAYDLSIGGMRFEMDRPVEPASDVAVKIILPTALGAVLTAPRAIFAMARVVWVNMDDVEMGGPVRMACVFRRFTRPGDEERIRHALSSGRYALAA